MTTESQARILHSARELRGWSMKELARRVKRPRESVSRAVNKGVHPRILEKVKEALGV